MQVLRDVDTLWMSGTPGYFPDDLIDFDADSLDSGVLRLTQSRGMARALRLGTREAVALVAALRALDASVGDALDPAEREVLTSTLEVLTTATGEAAATVDVQLSVEGDPAVLAAARTALREGRRLHLRYVDAADRTSERDVDPWQLVTGDERSYLSAWCHASGGERLFRLDRILAAQVLDEPVTTSPAPDVQATYRPAREHPTVRLSLDGRARWAAEQLPDRVRRRGRRGLHDGAAGGDLGVAARPGAAARAVPARRGARRRPPRTRVRPRHAPWPPTASLGRWTRPAGRGSPSRAAARR